MNTSIGPPFGTEPHKENVKEALRNAVKSFYDAGGEINIGAKVPSLFEELGMEVVSIKPMNRTFRPHELGWYWPKTFLEVYLPKLVDQGYLTQEQMDLALDEWKELESTPGSFCHTPAMVEVIGQKR